MRLSRKHRRGGPVGRIIDQVRGMSLAEKRELAETLREAIAEELACAGL